jgi:Concanavalin A-like lectin/glucanases superfamily
MALQQGVNYNRKMQTIGLPFLRRFVFAAFLAWFATASFALSATLSNPAVDSYNVRVGTETFAGLYKFTTNTLLVETAQAITNLGSDTIKFYLGPNTSGQAGVTLTSGETNMMLIVKNDPSYHAVLDMPFRHFIMWTYTIANGGTTFQSGNYTTTDATQDYREMYDLATYLLTNYSNSGKTFYLGHWEGDGYLGQANGWTTNVSMSVVTAMVAWENNRQKAVDDAKAAAAAHYTNVSVFYYAEANRVRDAMFNGTNNNVRMINYVIPYVTNLDYISYSSYDAQNLSSSDLYTTLNYMEAHFPTNKAGKVPGERMWIGEYGWGGNSFATQEVNSRSYIQRLLGWQGQVGPLQFILFWEMYNNQSTGGTNYCLIDPTDTKEPCWYLHQRFINEARLLTAQFNESNGRLPTGSEFSSLTMPMLNAPLPAPVPIAVSNLSASRASLSSENLAGTVAQGIYGDDCAKVWVFWGTQDGGTVSNAWANSMLIGTNKLFNQATFTALLTNLATQTNYYFRFYSANSNSSAWAPSSSQFSTVSINPPDYQYRLKIAFTNYSGSETLANFPVMVTFGTNLPGFSYSQFASSTGGDLRFTDSSGVGPLNFEIDEWNPSGTSIAWVQVPAFSATNNYIWAYWGNSNATTLPAASTNGATWSPNHYLVWHLAHSGFPYFDSAQEYPGISGVAPALIPAFIGHGGSFNGSGDYIGTGNLNLGNAFTLSAWIKLNFGDTNIQTIWANKTSGWNSDGFALFVNSYNTTDGMLRLETGDGTGGSAAVTATGVIATGQWYYIAAAVNRTAGTAQLFVNGVDQTQNNAAATDFGNQSAIDLGRITNGSYFLAGQIDEARIESGVCSSNWVSASYLNVVSNTSFASYSTINPQPTLSLTTGTGANLLLTWPASAGTVFLYTATNLIPPVTWTLATNTAALVNGEWQVSVSSTNSSNSYYRLQYR